MKKILIITDAWEPQVNGVVTTMTTVLKHLKKKNMIHRMDIALSAISIIIFNLRKSHNNNDKNH